MYRIEGPEDGGKAPNGPNFSLIVVLFGIAILAFLAIGLVASGHAGKLVHVVRPDQHPTSQLRGSPPASRAV